MSKDRLQVEKGMFLMGGSHPARMSSARQYSPDAQQTLDDPSFVSEMKTRLQDLREAIDFIRCETPSGPESQEQWLKRMGYL